MKRLYELEPAEVSLVSKGANKKKFLIYKSLTGETMDQELAKEIAVSGSKAASKVEKILKENKVKKEDEKALKAVARLASTLSVDPKLAFQVIEKAMEGDEGDDVEPADELDFPNEQGGDMSEETDMEADKPKKMSAEHHKMAMDYAKKAYKSMVNKLGYRKYPDAEMAMKDMDNDMDEESEEEDGVKKSAVIKADGTLDLDSVPEEIRPAFEMITKANQEMVKKNQELEKTLSEERRERRFKEFVAKAQEFTHYSGDKKELAQEMMDLADASPKLYEKFEKQLRAVEAEKEAVSKQLFGEIGTTRQSGGAADAESKIDAAVRSVVEKSGETVTYADAYTKFIKTPEGQKLYADYKASRKDGI